MNVRPPWPADPEWLRIQDDYLQTELNSSVIPDATELPELEPGISLWQGDITKIKADAIVNAANNALLGCFIPNHGCIDNAIHSAARDPVATCLPDLDGKTKNAGASRPG